MTTEAIIYQKLEAFIRKFYTNELIKGMIFFFGLGLLYLLFTLSVEFFLWLQPKGRTLLFGLFILVELFLLIRLIFFPIFKLVKLQKGIDYHQAATIIGHHFNEVGDRLTNFLQLVQSKEQSELLLASIEQKSIELQPIPFSKAINFKANKKYLPWALLPIVLFLIFFATGNGATIFQSFNRVVHYNTPFTPPAPFEFKILNPSLTTEQNKDFTIRIRTEGKVVPQKTMIFLDNESYFMKTIRPGVFEYTITHPMQDVSFHLEANEIRSVEHRLKVIAAPSISNFEMQLRFPSYLKKKPETIQGTGNATVPEGTQVLWKITTQATQKVDWKTNEATVAFTKSGNQFVLAKNIFQDLEYQIDGSNLNSIQHEKLNYQLVVVKDQFPTIQVRPAPDSLKLGNNYILGQISDDYGLTRLQIVYYPKGKQASAKRGTIPIKTATFDQFVFSFPSNLPIQSGIVYDYYFEVFDNDALHHFKRTKSTVFSYRLATAEEKEAQSLQQQSENSTGLEKSLKRQEKQLAELEQLKKTGKEKNEFEFKEQQKADDFLKRQVRQEQMMGEYAEKIKANLELFKSEQKDVIKEDLVKRLEKATQDSDKNKKLLNELQKLNDKIGAEELLEKLEKYQQQTKNQTKNLAQLVELTKRFYVEKKTQQLANKLNQLSDQQDKTATIGKDNTSEKQADINTAFDKIQNELKELLKDNKELKAPLDLPKNETKEKSIDDDLEKALDELEKNNTQKAQSKQKSAAKKMKELSQKMHDSMEDSKMEQLQEDVKMLRQITDNLLAFSNEQEEVMKQFKSIKPASPSFNKNIKTQQNLKQQFQHINDSLFAMSLRNPKIAEEITKQVGNVEYSINSAIETLTNSQFAKGVSYQQYAVSEANKLADRLSDVLFNMQMALSGMSGGKPKPGQGQGMQLPDIIKKQQGLGEQIKQGMKENGQDSKSGKTQKNGQSGEDGEGNAEAIMQIYKEQRKLREALEAELEMQGLGSKGQAALDQMKQLEKQLLNKGFKNESIQRAFTIQQELLKLKTALQQQGEENKRESQSNKREFSNQSNELPKP
ncbi:MAG: hypothetical protein RLZZ44_1000, partial [Bacteroidota bacterium]